MSVDSDLEEIGMNKKQIQRLAEEFIRDKFRHGAL